MGHIMTQDVVMKKHLSFDDSQNCETKVGEQPYIGMYKNNSTIAITICYDSRLYSFYQKDAIFLDCLRKDLRRYANEEPSYPNCTTPWHQSFLGDTEIDSKPKSIFCNQTQKERLNNLDIEFTKKAAAYQNDNCPSMSEPNCIFLHTYGIN